MNSSNPNRWKLYIAPKAFRRASKTKKWQIEAKPTWHLFWRENQLVRPKKQFSLIWRTENHARDQGTVQLKDSICFKSVQIGSKVGLNQQPGPFCLQILQTFQAIVCRYCPKSREFLGTRYSEAVTWAKALAVLGFWPCLPRQGYCV
jgi:hypothetical protein